MTRQIWLKAMLVVCTVLTSTVSYSHQNFCVRGGCLAVTDKGDILFGNQYVANDLWPTGERHKPQLLTCRVNGKVQYVTADEEGKRLYLVDKPERGSYWRFTIATRKRIQTTICTSEILKGGPFYISIDLENPMTRKGPMPECKPGKQEYTVYPAILTADAKAATTFQSMSIAP